MKQDKKQESHRPAELSRRITVRITTTAMFMAMCIAMCTFSIPVPGGHLYLCDAVICTAAILLDPFSAFVVGGVGTFLGDLILYPVSMFVSLISHGLQALAISLISRYVLRRHPILASGIGTVVGSVIMIIGYSLGRAFVYSTPEAAILKLPWEFAQAAIGALLAMILCWRLRVRDLYERILGGR